MLELRLLFVLRMTTVCCFVQDLDCAMLEDSSTTCRLDDLLCLLTSQSQLIANTQHLPALSSTLQLFIKTHDHLMFADGPLSHQHRHYVALLVRTVRSY